MKNNNSKNVLKVVGVIAVVAVSVVAYMGLKFYELENNLHFMDSATCLFTAVAIFLLTCGNEEGEESQLGADS